MTSPADPAEAPQTAGPGADPAGPGRDDVPPLQHRWARVTEVVVLVLFGIAAVGFRFATRSPLWLDEALSVNIAKLPLGDIPDALRHDGHPPLYYWLLHGWMSVFGQGDWAVRALSGLFALALFPLVWVAGSRLAGRRGAWASVVILAVSPYAVRYGTETRMYSMVMVLALAAWLVADDALHRPTWGRLVGLAALTGALLYSHYWAIWFLAASTLCLLVHLWRARKAGRRDDVRASWKVLGALVAGGVAFLPWLPVLAYQSAHTGTPWATPVRPPEMLAKFQADLGGGPQGEAIMLGLLLVVLVLLALFGRAVDRRHIELDLGTRPESRPLALVVVITLGIANVVGFVTGAAFATRYLAVIVPLVIALAGLGAARFSGAVAFRVVLGAVLVLGLAGSARNVVHSRTQAKVAAQAIVAGGGPGDLVITCPDQLGPSLARALPDDREILTYPAFAGPERVDWVDYTERLDKASPEAFGKEALRRAAGRRLWFVWSGTYRTHEGTCEKVLNTMLRSRPWATNPVTDKGEDYFEHESVWDLPATAPS